MERIEYIEILYQRYLAHTISDKEHKELMQFFDTCSDEELQYVVGKLSREADVEIPVSPEQEERAALVFGRINEVTAPKIRKLRPIKYLSIAAALLCTLSIGYYYWRNSQPEPQTLTSIYGDDVAPGGNRATITLSDGTTAELSGEQQEVVINGQEFTYGDGNRILSASEEIKSATITTPRSGQYQLTLPDGSKVWLNAESSLTYPVRFSDSLRTVTLKGEAFFDVSRNEQKPFIVESGEQRVTVIGTTFNINAYQDTDATVTTLATGKVRIVNFDGTVFSDLKPGQQATYKDNEIEVNSIDPTEFTSWKDGLFVLKDADFITVKRQLERWYDVTFVGEPKSQETISAILPRNVNLSDLLQSMQGYTTMKFRIEGRTIMVE